MGKRIGITLLVVIAAFAVSSAVLADPIPVVNSSPARPVLAFDDTTGQIPTQPSLQQLLDQLDPGIFNAYADQNPTAIWAAAAQPPNTIIVPVLSFEYNPQENPYSGAFGLFTGTTDALTYLPVFNNDALPGNVTGGPYTANVQWITQDSGYVQVNAPGVGQISYNAFADIPYNFFGFYAVDESGSYSFTADILNPNGTVQALAYQYPTGDYWAIAFEYQDPQSGVYDFNDLLIKVESINTAIPEPSTLILFGTGFGILGLISRLRKR